MIDVVSLQTNLSQQDVSAVVVGIDGYCLPEFGLGRSVVTLSQINPTAKDIDPILVRGAWSQFVEFLESGLIIFLLQVHEEDVVDRLY